jgi:hypothetical protein
MSSPLAKFSTSIDDLLAVYHQAVADFNSGRNKPSTDPGWVDLKKLLDAKVMVAGIDKPVAYKGKDAVINFLVAAGASFTNDTITQTLTFGNNLAALCGTADWADSDQDNDGQIIFNFEFVNRSITKSNWKILRLSATNPT